MIRLSIFIGFLTAVSCAAQPDFADTTLPDFASTAVPVTQTPGKYPSLLWQISGNGLKKPSYLYGTMHVSRKMVFRLTDSFFKALYSADVVALESDANKWIDELAEENSGSANIWDLMNGYNQYGYQGGFYNTAFSVSFPKKSVFEYLLQHEEELADAMMYRKSDHARNFSEEQFLDMFIHQAGMKLGKQVTGLEEYKQSRKMVNRSRKPDPKSEKDDKKKKRIDYYGEDGIYEQIENAYRNGDLDLLDSLEILTAPSKNFLRWMLWERNKVMVRSFDSIVRTGKVLFAGVGAAHVPGDSGVVEMLRRMGYTVRPVFGKTTRWSSNQKEKIDARHYRHSMQPYTSHRGDFSAIFPGTPLDYSMGGNAEYFYPDMANGAYYKLTRLPYYGALSAQSPDHVLNRIDSLLYENIPGKIISKKRIVKNGHPGFDIQNRTSLGDFQRYMIIATPVNLWFIKMAGQRNFATGKNADVFFNSIQIHEKSESNWQTYSPPAGGYEISWPTYVQRKRSKRDTSHLLPGHADLHASDKAGNYYFLRKADLYSDYDYFEEDTFELSELINSMAYNLKGTDVRKDFTRSGPYAEIRAYMTSQVAQSQVYLRCVMINRRYYMIGCKHSDPKAAEQFLMSFKPVKHLYHKPFSMQTDSAMMFTTSTVEIENFGRPREDDDEYDYPEYGWGYNTGQDDDESKETKDTLGIAAASKYTSYEYSNGQTVGISRYISGAFETSTTTDSIHARLVRRTRRTGSVLSKFDTLSTLGWKRVIYELTDTATSRGRLTHVWYRGRDCYYIYTQTDTCEGLTPFVSEFFSRFMPIDSLMPFSIPENLRKDSLLRGIFHPDSLIRRNHRQALFNQVEDWEKKDVPAMMAACKKLNRHLSKDLERRCHDYLLSKMAATNHKDVIPYLKELFYASGDTVQQQIDILNSLSSMSSADATSAFIQLMIEETPLSNSEWEVNDLFSNYTGSDSFHHLKPLFPAAFELMRYKEYKADILRTAARMLDSNQLEPEKYRNYLSSLLLEFRDEWKRQLSDNTREGRSYYRNEGEDKNDDENYGRYVSESMGEGFLIQSIYSMSRYNSRGGWDRGSRGGSSEIELISLGKLLVPYYQQPEVRKRLDKTLQTGKRPDRFEWVLLHLNKGLQVPDSVLKIFITRRDYRWGLLSAKLPAGLDSLRKVLDSGRSMAEAFICHSAIGPKDSLVYLGERKIDHKDRKGTAYFFKHTYKNGYYDEWYLNMVMIPADKKVVPGTADPLFWIRNREYTDTKSDKEQIDDVVEYMQKFDHLRWAPHATSMKRRRYMYEDF